MSKNLWVGHVIQIFKDQYVPADLIILKQSEETIFVWTDQLDGETDWKYWESIGYFKDKDLINSDDFFEVEEPNKDIYWFKGKLNNQLPITIENTLWWGM